MNMTSRLLSTTLIKPPTNHNKSPVFLTARVGVRKGRVNFRTVSDSSQGSPSMEPYQGVYGLWTVESSDVKDVILYRSGLVTAAASFVAASSAAFLPEDSWLNETIKQNHDLFYLVGAGGLGLPLFLIHIYVTEIKRTLQALWALGVVGSFAAYAALARPAQ